MNPGQTPSKSGIDDVRNAQRLVGAKRTQLAGLGIRNLWLFGSRARGESVGTSDWDFLVEFNRSPSFDDFMGAKLLLEESLGGPVDLLSRRACKPRFLAAIQDQLRNVA
jgi:predicted nucleotidyltransferase